MTTPEEEAYAFAGPNLAKVPTDELKKVVNRIEEDLPFYRGIEYRQTLRLRVAWINAELSRRTLRANEMYMRWAAE